MSRGRLYLLILGVCLAGCLWLLAAIYSPGELPLGCLFKKATGVPCPACGSTGAVKCLVAGDWSGIIRHNPIGILTALAGALCSGWIVYDLITRRDTFYRFYYRTEKRSRNRKFIIIAGTAVLANWIWTILKF